MQGRDFINLALIIDLMCVASHDFFFESAFIESKLSFETDSVLGLPTYKKNH
jgi:hypothetical protein